MGETALNIPSTPCYVADTNILKHNLDILRNVQQKTGCGIVLALKGFAMFSLFGLIRQYLSGTTASSLYEARLGYEEFGRDVHVYSPAYKSGEFEKLLQYATHISFNSLSQWKRFRPLIAKTYKNIRCGLRINPEHSEVRTVLYDPCAPGSRLGITSKELIGGDIEGITGLHFHTLCELNSDALERTLEAVEEKFSLFLPNMKWINFGGGHHITRPDYDIEKLCRLIKGFRKKYNVDVYLEPGEAIALGAGVLIASVLDIVCNKGDIAILDTSAAAHMPDVLEMPYRPEIEGAGNPGEYKYTYRLGGLTCLAGDVIGEYSFPEPLKTGSRVVFKDMLHYTMVKNNMFNGIRLPSIAIHDPDTKTLRVVKEFRYEDYRGRLS